jgi:hypothetical protein
MSLEQIGGAGLVLLFLADIFLTVLYARAGTGLLALRWNRLVWASLKGATALLGRRRGAALSLAGPLIVVSMIAFWALGLTVGAALIVQPELGTAIRPTVGNTPKDFVTALLAAGNSLSIVGGGDYVPHTAGTRILYMLNSLIGASVLSLVLSYLVQIYSGLRERNALALTIDLMTGGDEGGASFLSVAILFPLRGSRLFGLAIQLHPARSLDADRHQPRSAEAWRARALRPRRVASPRCPAAARDARPEFSNRRRRAGGPAEIRGELRGRGRDAAARRRRAAAGCPKLCRSAQPMGTARPPSGADARLSAGRDRPPPTSRLPQGRRGNVNA